MLWRFAPMSDPLVSEWHSRDLDSRVNEREVAAVKDWLQNTTMSYHAMRDNPYHGTTILGGMFGMRVVSEEKFKEMREVLHRILNSGFHWGKGVDQSLLSEYLWPVARGDMASHDSFTCSHFRSKVVRPFPTKRIAGPDYKTGVRNNFVGSNGGQISLANVKACPKECRPKNHKDWLLC